VKTKTSKPIDMTHLIPVMSEHDHVKFPEVAELHLSAAELEFFLTTLTHIHTTLVDQVKDLNLSKVERKTAYDFALGTENLYHSIFRQLKLYKPERSDLN